MLKYILLWFPMLILAILNGTARDLWYKKWLGDLTAHQVSTITLIVLFALYIFFVLRIYPPVSGNQAILVGILWLVMTLVFEFGFGRFRGRSWAELFADYNILEGRIWILILIWVTFAPLLFFRLFSK